MRLVGVLTTLLLAFQPMGWGASSRTFNDAANECFEIQSAIDNAIPLTFAGWQNSDDAANPGDVLSIGEAGTSNNRFRLISGGNVAGDPMRANTRTSTSGTANSSSGYSVDTWHYATAVFSATNARAAYIDGGSKGTNTTNLTPSGSNNTRIGDVTSNNGAGVCSTVNEFSGELAYVVMWDVALTDATISSLAAGEIVERIEPNNQLGLWLLLEESGDALDISGNGNTMTDVNTVGSSTDGPPAMFGGGLPL